MVQRRARVVIVDDDPSIRGWLRVALTASDAFEVVGEAADGAEAMEQAVCQHPDAIVMDLQMPLVDGYTAVVMLQRRMPHTTIVVHSAVDDDDDVDNVTKLGVPVVRKTGDPEALLAALHAALTPALTA